MSNRTRRVDYRTKRPASAGGRVRAVARPVQPARARLSLANNPIGILMLMSLFMFAIAGAYWHTNGLSFNLKGFAFKQGDDGAYSDETRDALNARHINPKFMMGGVQLGMTQQMVQDIHPHAQVGIDRAGEPVITIPTDNGILVAWLFSNNEIINVGGTPVRDDLKRIYRLRLDQAHASLSETDILTLYGREYGRPIEAACARAGQGDSSRCAYRWWGGDGIEVEAIAKKKNDLNGRAYTQLTTIATNTIKSPRRNVVTLSALNDLRRLAALN